MILTATIESFEYVATEPLVTTTPLGETMTSDVEIDSYRVVFSVGKVADHPFYFRPEAIANRIVGYALADGKAAVESLVREVVFGWAPSLQPADPENRIDVNGGVDSRIDVVWTADAEAQHAAMTDAEAARIVRALEFFSEPPPPPAPVETPTIDATPPAGGA
jgi:hypothetical protein